MQAGLDSSVTVLSGQSSGEMAGSDGLIQESGGEPVSAGVHGEPAADEAIVVGPVTLALSRAGKRQHQVTARLQAGGEVVAVDTLDLARAGQRRNFVEQVLEKLALPEAEAEALEDGLDQRLLQLASAPVTPAASATAAAPASEFFVIDDAGDPELNGIYAALPLTQIANFDMRILEHVVVSDEDHQETRQRLVIRRGGKERIFEMTAAEFASNGRLRTVVFGSALPGADLKAGADVLRRAAIALSDPTIRRVTTATGWTADRTRFLVPGGFVDAGGYHDEDPAFGIPQVDLSDCDNAQRLGLRRLDTEQLREVKRHVAGDLLRLHVAAVMRALLGAAALAVLRGFAAPRSRPVVWLLGLTGGGKTFLASLLANLFGDYPLDAGGRIATWGSTANYLQMLGYYHRDCLFVIDDFKPEMIRHGEVVRLLQNAGDGTARGRLRHDAQDAGQPAGPRAAAGDRRGPADAQRQRPGPVDRGAGRQQGEGPGAGPEVRGDEPAVSRVHGRLPGLGHPRGAGRGLRRAGRALAGPLLREGRGMQNDARIASNHALLAAAFEQMAAYLADVWPEAQAAAEEFATEDVAGMVAASVGAAADDQGSNVFLEALRALLHWGRVAARVAGRRRPARRTAGRSSAGSSRAALRMAGRSSSCRWRWRSSRCSGRSGSRASLRCRSARRP